MALAALFAAAFLAATLLPAQSGALLAGLVLGGAHSVPLLLAVATLGNVLGSVVNWALGRQVARFSGRRWFPVSPARMAQALGWYARGGHWSLLLAWVPIIGDPLTLVAGVLREPLWRFLLVVTLAKGGRYIAVALLAARFA